MKEVWKDIPNYEDYQASNLGHIRSKDRVIISTRGGRRFYESVVLKFSITEFGYYQCTVSDTVNKTRKTGRIHRLVAMAFIANPDNKPQINHIDGNKLNNNIKNLEWSTAKENNKHAIDTGLRRKRFMAKISIEDVKDVKRMLKSGMTPTEISKNHKASYDSIYDIKRNKTWKDIEI